MPQKHRTAATKRERSYTEQIFWDASFQTAYADALRRNGKRSEEARITWAASRADGALAARRRSVKEQQ